MRLPAMAVDESEGLAELEVRLIWAGIKMDSRDGRIASSAGESALIIIKRFF